MTAAIITSRLDNDYYNFTMGQLVWRHYAGVEVTYALTNRTESVKLGHHPDLDELKAQIEQVRQLRFTDAEIAYLRGQGCFGEDYLDYLRTTRLPEVTVKRTGDQIDLRYTGDWAAAIFWETPLLAIITQLLNRTRGGDNLTAILTDADTRLERKITQLQAHPEIKFIEFGTRRRFSRDWQDYVVQRLQEELPGQLRGTSNVALARRHGLRPSGTMAHQLFMVTTALAEATGVEHPIAAAQAEVLDRFEAEYGQVNDGNLLVFLPDTFGTATALSLLEPEQAARWAGMRQDSGNPFDQVQAILDYYRAHGIDPHTKSVIPSDGLNTATMVALHERFGAETKLPFGVGTFLTNDTQLPSASLVIKPVLANGLPTVKLSDNLAKATGDHQAVYRRMVEADYHTTFRAQPVY